jgi:hypothetical protein
MESDCGCNWSDGLKFTKRTPRVQSGRSCTFVNFGRHSKLAKIDDYEEKRVEWRVYLLVGYVGSAREGQGGRF